jgi:hypothetical protein
MSLLWSAIIRLGSKSGFVALEDSTNFIWQLPKLEYIEVLHPNDRGNSTAGSEIRYKIKTINVK